MATTTTKEGGNKRGNSSSTPQAKTKPSLKPSTSQPKPTLTSSSSNKPIPNYLKPTISSSLDPSSSSRTTRRASTFNNSTPTAKPTSINRRKSLEKPSPTTNNPQKVLRGPTNTSTAINTNTRDVVKSVARTTLSSSVKISLPSPKPAPQRSFSSISSRPTKPAASIKRSLTTKAGPSSSGINVSKVVKKTAPKSIESDSSAEVEVEARDKDPLDHTIGGAEDEDDQEVQSLHEISEMPGDDEQLGDPVIAEEEQDRESANEKEPIEDNEESVESADHVSKGGEEGAIEEDSTKVEEKHVVVVLEGSSGETKEEDVEPESPAREEGGNKKETQDYNDVIKETASKLMENRRNKVRALAGAFETVISLDSK